MSEEPKVSKAGQELNAEEVYLFSLQISMMLKAGILPSEGIALLESESQSEREKNLLSKMRDVLELGNPFYTAMEAVGCFPEHAIRMVQIGEDTGRMEQVLTSLAQYYQQEHELRESMRQAVVYPAWLAVVIGIVTTVLVTQVLPVFQQVLEQMGSGLSPWAASLMNFGAFSKVGAIIFTVLLVAMAGYLFVSSRTTEGQERLRRFADVVFFKGALGVSVSRERFSSAISLSLASGLNLNEAMDRAILLVDDAKFKEKIEQC
ncbi:MAG: type II secretion system F family protein, partial [Clostridiales bacterium]|nr:type II secretion system F family protein [Clostridiales bacterium]